MNKRSDFAIAQGQHWYRIPVSSVHRFLKERWPPEWLAFYQTKAFGAEKYSIRYYARVVDIHKVFRWQLFPDEPVNEKTNRQYYQLMLSPLDQLPEPILSLRLRRIVFIPTTWEKFVSAVEINDLYDESPLEDHLWIELKRRKIEAQRQYFVPVKRRGYYLDFAIFCNEGKLDVETDGDTWHLGRECASRDNERDNNLTNLGWSILRFRGRRIQEEMAEYCIPAIMKSVNRLNGLKANGLVPRPFDPEHPTGRQQLTLFEKEPDYDID
ncbi:MAG: endonuclease domain-containing protein [Anaerolineales bacterium]